PALTPKARRPRALRAPPKVRGSNRLGPATRLASWAWAGRRSLRRRREVVARELVSDSEQVLRRRAGRGTRDEGRTAALRSTHYRTIASAVEGPHRQAEKAQF